MRKVIQIIELLYFLKYTSLVLTNKIYRVEFTINITNFGLS